MADMGTIIILGAVGVGAYLLFKNKDETSPTFGTGFTDSGQGYGAGGSETTPNLTFNVDAPVMPDGSGDRTITPSKKEQTAVNGGSGSLSSLPTYAAGPGITNSSDYFRQSLPQSPVRQSGLYASTYDQLVSDRIRAGVAANPPKKTGTDKASEIIRDVVGRIPEAKTAIKKKVS